MNKWQSLLTIVAVALLAGLGFDGLKLVNSTSAAVQSYTLDWSVVGGGGNASTQLSSTVGQTTTGWSAGAQQLGSGFWYGVSAPTCPDAYEPNEDFASAKPITPGVAIQGYICSATDEDWFKFDVTASQEITVDLTNLPKDYDLELYDPSNTRVGRSAGGGTANEHIDHTARSTGAYRVRVFGFGGLYDPANPYTLRVQVGGVVLEHKIYLPVILKRR